MTRTPAILDYGYARKIIAAHASRVQCEHDALLWAARAGRLLMEVKKRLLHGQWMGWVEDNCSTIGIRTAQLYMQVARYAEANGLAPNTKPISCLPSYREVIAKIQADRHQGKFHCEHRPKCEGTGKCKCTCFKCRPVPRPRKRLLEGLGFTAAEEARFWDLLGLWGARGHPAPVVLRALEQLAVFEGIDLPAEMAVSEKRMPEMDHQDMPSRQLEGSSV